MKPKKQLTNAERQKLLDDISADDLAKIQQHKASTKGAMPVDNEWLIMTEFAITFGWQAYNDLKQDLIGMEEVLTLISAARKLGYSEMFNDAQASFIGAVSAQSKNPGKQFEKLTKQIVRQTKVDE